MKKAIQNHSKPPFLNFLDFGAKPVFWEGVRFFFPDSLTSPDWEGFIIINTDN